MDVVGAVKGRKIFVTGGVGFIGSHTVLCLLEHGYYVTIIDNLDNAFEEAYRRMQELAGDRADRMKFIKADLRRKSDIERIFKEDKFDAVIHFAGRKAVGESVQQPWLYYDHNVLGAINLVEVMREHNVKNMVFSSSCTVYGNPTETPINETHPLLAVSPYGRSKLIIEEIFRDYSAADPSWRTILLRYFNPVGAHPSGKIGEHPVGIPNNLMPYIQQVALGQRAELSVFGSDYPTRDGTCVRDYIHVMDLAEGHVAALDKLFRTSNLGCVPINLGTGTGSTVLEMVKGHVAALDKLFKAWDRGCVPIKLSTGTGPTMLEMVKAFENASGKEVKIKMAPRRGGDSVAVWAATETAEKELGWKTKLNVDDMCRDQWKWASQYPKGYEV